MASDITYGPALMMAKAYHDNDAENFDAIIEVMDDRDLVGSAFQIIHTLLFVIPRNRIEGKESYNLREEAFDGFSFHLAKNTNDAVAFSGASEEDVITAGTTIVMGSIVPLLEGDYTPSLSMDHEGINERSFYVILSSIIVATVKSFGDYSPLIDYLEQSGKEFNYDAVHDFLIKLLPPLMLKASQ